MPITKSTYGESISVLVSNLINHFSLGLKLVGITSNDGTNLARCKGILESNFYNTGVFELVKHMFMMECLSHVLYNTCKEGVM